MAKCEECGTTWLDVDNPKLQSACPSCELERLRDVVQDVLCDPGNGDLCRCTIAKLQAVRGDAVSRFLSEPEALALIEKLDAAEAIVDKLPKTADGVPVVPGMVTWCSDRRPFAHQWDLRLRSGETFTDHCKRNQERHYSTREAAEKAGEE